MRWGLETLINFCLFLALIHFTGSFPSICNCAQPSVILIKHLPLSLQLRLHASSSLPLYLLNHSAPSQSWNGFLWGHHTANKVPLSSSSLGCRAWHSLITMASVKSVFLGFCDSVFSWFLSQVPKVSFKNYISVSTQSVAASHSFIPVALKFLVFPLPQSDHLSLNDHIHENGLEICIPFLSFKLHLMRRHPHLDIFPPPQIQHVPNQAHPLLPIPLLPCDLLLNFNQHCLPTFLRLKTLVISHFSLSYSLPISCESSSCVYFTFVNFKTFISSFSLLILIQILVLSHRLNIQSSITPLQIPSPN